MRKYLLSIIVLLGGWALQSCHSAKGSQEPNKEVGLALYSVKYMEDDLLGSLDRIANIGYSYVEMSNYGDSIFGYTQEQFADVCKQHGLQLIASNTLGGGIFPEDEAHCLADWEKVFADHERMGVKYVSLVACMAWGSLERTDSICQLMNKIGRMARQHGIEFLYHTHNMEFNTIEGTDIPVIDYMMAHTDPRLVNLETDVFWVMQGGRNPAEFISSYPGRTRLMHVKDYYLMGESGRFDYQSIFDAFYAQGGQHYFIEMEEDVPMETLDEKARELFDIAVHYPSDWRPFLSKWAGKFSSDPAERQTEREKSFKAIETNYDYLNRATYTARPLQDEWTSLIDENLTDWEIYQSYELTDTMASQITSGKTVEGLSAPVGYNVNKGNQWTVVKEGDELLIHNTGTYYGCIFTRGSFSNYHLRLKYRFGDNRYEPRKDKAYDSGLLYHSQGPCGVEPWRAWKRGHEFQLIETGTFDGNTGDYWPIVNLETGQKTSMTVHCAAQGEENPFFNAYRYGPAADAMQVGSPQHPGFCTGDNFASPHGEWTEVELICEGDKATHIVNGQVKMILENSIIYWMDDAVDGGIIAIPLTDGQIQLQSEAAEVWFKDIEIKKVKK